MSNKVAYVTGGMGGIGTAICQRLAKDGFTVVAGCGPTRDFEKWLDEQKALGYSFHASVGDVGNWESTVAAFDKVKAAHGPVSVLVNNAGITRDGQFRKMSKADWDAVISTNLDSMFNVTKQVIDGMVEAVTSAPTWLMRSVLTCWRRLSLACPPSGWASPKKLPPSLPGSHRTRAVTPQGLTSRSMVVCTWADVFDASASK